MRQLSKNSGRLNLLEHVRPVRPVMGELYVLGSILIGQSAFLYVIFKAYTAIGILFFLDYMTPLV
jgi:hypothetical protein